MKDRNTVADRMFILDEADNVICARPKILSEKEMQEFQESYKKTRLQKKEQFKQMTFPFNLMANCIDKNGDIKK